MSALLSHLHKNLKCTCTPLIYSRPHHPYHWTTYHRPFYYFPHSSPLHHHDTHHLTIKLLKSTDGVRRKKKVKDSETENSLFHSNRNLLTTVYAYYIYRLLGQIRLSLPSIPSCLGCGVDLDSILVLVYSIYQWRRRKECTSSRRQIYSIKQSKAKQSKAKQSIRKRHHFYFEFEFCISGVLPFCKETGIPSVLFCLMRFMGLGFACMVWEFFFKS